MESKKYKKLINKEKKNKTPICREQISAYQWGEGNGEEQSRRGWLRYTNYYV